MGVYAATRVENVTEPVRVDPRVLLGRERGRDAAEEKQRKLFQSSPRALWEIISYWRDLENLTQSMLTLPL